MEGLAATHDAAVQVLDTSVVRVHQHGACIAGNSEQPMGRSRDGLTAKIHAVADTNGLPVQLGLTPGEAHDSRLRSALLSELSPQTMLLADRGYDADWIRVFVGQQRAWAYIPPKRHCLRLDPSLGFADRVRHDQVKSLITDWISIIMSVTVRPKPARALG